MSYNKKRAINRLKPKEYQIYGIFDFHKKKLTYISLDADQAEIEFLFGSYDEKRFDVVEFSVLLA
jgi:hypothetical protein